jgi:hypothetical protein
MLPTTDSRMMEKNISPVINRQCQEIRRQGFVAMATSTSTLPTTDSRMIEKNISPVINRQCQEFCKK